MYAHAIDGTSVFWISRPVSSIVKAGNFLDALFAEFSVQPGSGHHSRVSVITYAAGASLIGDLEKFDNDGLDNVLPYLNASSSNVVNIQR